MKTISDIQQLIEDKAKKQLRDDIKRFIKSVSDNPLFLAIQDEKIIVSWNDDEPNQSAEKKEITLRSFFWSDTHPAGGMIMKNLLPDYIQKESEKFLEDVESLKTQMSELLNSQEQ